MSQVQTKTKANRKRKLPSQKRSSKPKDNEIEKFIRDRETIEYVDGSPKEADEKKIKPASKRKHMHTDTNADKHIVCCPHCECYLPLPLLSMINLSHFYSS